jgi:hypothetical protein
MDTQTENKTKTGHEFLRELCSFNADFNAFVPRINPISNRVEYIRYQLEKFGLPCELDIFNADNPNKLNMDKPKFVNVYSFFKGENATNDTIVFLAHHDINNSESENCQDNTASVCNLLHLCELLQGKKLNKNVLVAFTDAEEVVSPDNCGAKRLSILSKLGFFGNVTKAINLELTANGSELWVSCLSSKKLMYEVQTYYKARIVQTPYNDAFVLENNGMESVCIGTLTPNELDRAIGRGFCSTWALCHKEEDTFDKARENDMQNFVENVLLKMVEA